MKTLYESLLDDFEKLEDSIDPIKEIKKFLDDNYLKSNSLKISKKPNKDGLYEVDCRKCRMVKVKNNEIISLTNGMFEFVGVDYFCCNKCNNLTTLEGSPKKCDFFNCYDCNNLTTLEGISKEIAVGLNCSHCTGLTSLKGAPRETGYFNCSWCTNLTSLEGAPIKVEGDFICFDCIKIKSLKGAPKEVEGRFDCSYCNNLTSLEGAPKKCKNFNCKGCDNLLSFEGMPEQIGENLDCSSCTPGNTLGMGNPMPPTDNGAGTEPILPVKTKKKKKKIKESLLDDFEAIEKSINPIEEIKQFLKDNYLDSDKLKISGSPNKDGLYEVDCRNCAHVDVRNCKITSLTNGMFEFVNVKNFYCVDCVNLTSLEGAPKEVKGNFICSHCVNLTSLEGAPKEVGGKFNCSFCKKLTSLKGAPENVGGIFCCSNCGKEFTEQDVRNKCNVRGLIYTTC